MANKIVALFAVCFCGPAVATGGPPNSSCVVINRREQKQGSCFTKNCPAFFESFSGIESDCIVEEPSVDLILRLLSPPYIFVSSQLPFAFPGTSCASISECPCKDRIQLLGLIQSKSGVE